MNKTMILAIGGAGCNMAEYCLRNASSGRLKNVEFLFADTDAENITRLAKKGYKTVILQPSSSANPFAIAAGVYNIVIFVGLGGKTGSSFVEPVAKMAKLYGAKNTMLIVTMPFLFEGESRAMRAAEVLKSLSKFYVKTLKNEDLVDCYPELNFMNAFEYSDKEALNIIEMEGL